LNKTLRFNTERDIMKEAPVSLKDMGYYHDSQSGATATKDEMFLKLWLRKEHKMNFPMAARPWAGISVQHGANLALGLQDYNEIIGQQEGMPIAEATRHMMAKYDEYKPRDWDDGKDAEEYDAFREVLPEMMAHSIAGVNEFFQGANQIAGEHQRWFDEPKSDVPIMLYQDFSAAGTQIDLKCSLPMRNPVKKDGSRSWRTPKPKTEPTWQQVVQQSIYWKATGETPALLFVTGSGYHICTPENCEALSEENLNRAYNQAVQSWVITQNLLKAANGSWNTLFGLVQPDINEIARRHGPSIVTLAKQAWSI
jgi:hypothetical protein